MLSPEGYETERGGRDTGEMGWDECGGELLGLGDQGRRWGGQGEETRKKDGRGGGEGGEELDSRAEGSCSHLP